MVSRVVRGVWGVLGVACGLAGLTASLASGQAKSPSPEEIESAFDAVLAEVVEDGRVDYPALQADPGPLDDWLHTVETIPFIEVRKWSKNSAVAFYINAYNGHVLRIIRDRYPIQGENPEFPKSSIQQIEGVWKMPLQVAGQEVSLDTIEKELLLGEYKVTRAHFALVCASKGCPHLRNEAYHGKTLYPELSLAAQQFIRSKYGSQLDTRIRTLRLSPLFDWYRKDFANLAGTARRLDEVFGDLARALEFVAAHLPREQSEFIKQAQFQVEWLPYDWALNE